MLVIAIVLLTLLSVGASHRVAYAFTLPILRLNESVHKLRYDDDFGMVITRMSDDEIGELTDQFNEMVRHIKVLMARIIEEQTARRKYELLLLQAQINPHFLYNTLDSIVWLVRMKKNADAEVMLTALTTFFKTGLNKGNDIIRLAQEFDNVQSYMTIQTYRYKTRLTYTAHLDDCIRDVEVPKLILQPLVENAIYHGVKEKDSPGCIRMRCLADGDRIRICVEDDGLGMEAEKLERLREQLRSGDIQNRDSYGVLNVYERLRLFFSGACSMHVESWPGRGTRVTILLERGKKDRGTTDDRG